MTLPSKLGLSKLHVQGLFIYTKGMQKGNKTQGYNEIALYPYTNSNKHVITYNILKSL